MTLPPSLVVRVCLTSSARGGSEETVKGTDGLVPSGTSRYSELRLYSGATRGGCAQQSKNNAS